MTSTTLPHTTVIGSLCTGYGGLDMGVAAALGGTANLAWVADNDPHITRLFARRFPGSPNLGDLSAVRWPRVERVDVITAGFPCQDVSAAGSDAGIVKGKRSSVWSYVLDAVRHLRPRLLVLENVAALRWRGLDQLLADLAQAGYDARWRCVRACDIGAPHQRERVFVVAHPVCQRRPPRPFGPASAYATRTPGAPLRCAVPSAPHAQTHPSCAHRQTGSHSRTPAAHAARQRRLEGQLATALFVRSPHAALCGHRYVHRQRSGVAQPPSAYAWGDHEAAIRRWEEELGRAAPAPTEAGTRGQPRLSAVLVEWMMGLPEGWVTGSELGIPRPAQLQALGNGVVPQQATVAVRHLLNDEFQSVPSELCGLPLLECHVGDVPWSCRGKCGSRRDAE